MSTSRSGASKSKDASSRRFAETRWSLVAGLELGADERQRCLEELCRTYYYPVYAEIRRAGYDEDQACDYTAGFFEFLIEDLDQSRPRGRFRTYLAERLDAFLAAPATADGVTRLDAPGRSELKARYAAQSSNGGDAFDVDYAREVMATSLQALRSEAIRNGRLEMYEQLAPFLTREPTVGHYLDLSEKLGLSRISLVIALKRLRARFNQLVNRQIAETVDNPDDLESERQTLHSALRGRDS